MNTTFTNYAEKKAKQFLNLLQGYTKGIRMTAILILLLMGVSNAWGENGTITVYFKNNLTWENVYVYFYKNAYWEDNGAGSSTSKTAFASGPNKMTYDSNLGLYKFTYTGDYSQYISFTQHEQKDYNNFHNTSAVYRGDFNTLTPVYTPNTTSNETRNSTTYYNNGTWSAVPSQPDTPEPDIDFTPTKVYLDPTTKWNDDGARFAAYFCNGTSDAEWVDMTQNRCDSKYYECKIPDGHQNVIFCRMNPGTTANNFNDGTRWNQTGDLTIPKNENNLFTITDWGIGNWSNKLDVVSITTNNPENGTIEVSRAAVNIGETVTVIVAPDNGYKVASCTVAGETQSVTEEGGRFDLLICDDTEISATFELKEETHPITITSDGNGTVDKSSVNVGATTASLSITANPNQGYKFKNWTATEGITINTPTNISTTITATKSGTLTANFEQRYVLRGSIKQPGDPLGGMAGWDANDNSTYVSAAIEGNIMTIAAQLQANTQYKFMIRDLQQNSYNGQQYSGEIKENEIWTLDGSNDIILKTTVAGVYNFVYDVSANSIKVLFPTTYTVTYSHVPAAAADAPTTSPSVASGDRVVSGTSVTFTAKDAKTGYTWKGWYSNNTGSGTALSANKEYTTTITTNTTIYAVYTPTSYSITYELNGGSGTMTPTSYDITTETFDLPTTPTRNGYTFVGWYDNQNLAGNAITTIPQGSTGNKTFYAKWLANKYTVKFHENGGEGTMADQGFTYGDAQTLTENAFTLENALFVGWATSEENAKNGVVAYNNGQSVSNLTTTKDGVVNLYAVWATISITACPERIKLNDQLTLTISYKNIPENYIYRVYITNHNQPVPNNNGEWITISRSGTLTHTSRSGHNFTAGENNVVVQLYNQNHTILLLTSEAKTFIAEQIGTIAVYTRKEAEGDVFYTNLQNVSASFGVSITAPTIDGYRFDRWEEISGGIVFTPNTYSSTVTVTASNGGQIRAYYKKLEPKTIYLKTVEGTTDGVKWYVKYNDTEYLMDELGCTNEYYKGVVPEGTSFQFVSRDASTNIVETKGTNLQYVEGKTLYNLVSAGASGDKIFFKPNKHWKEYATHKYFVARFYANSVIIKDLVDDDGDGIYECEKPAGATKVSFCLTKERASDNSWNDWPEDKAAQTHDNVQEGFKDGKNLFTLGDDQTVGGENDNGTWSTHADTPVNDEGEWTTFNGITYRITFNQQGATTAGTTHVDVAYHASMPEIEKLPTQTEKKFGGYYTEAGVMLVNAFGEWQDAMGYIASGTWESEACLTLHAHWTDLTPEITDVTLNADIFEPVDDDKEGIVTADPTINEHNNTTLEYIVCWKLLYSNGREVEGTQEDPDKYKATVVEGEGDKVKFSIAGLATGNYIIRASLRTGSDCNSGKEISRYDKQFSIVANRIVTVNYTCDGREIMASTKQNAHVINETKIQAPDIVGYTFKEWVAGDGVIISTADKTSKTIQFTAYYDGYLTATYTKDENIIYFYNTLGWQNVYVYFYSGFKIDGNEVGYWNDEKGTGSQPKTNDNDWYGGSYKGYAQMEQIAGTDIWYVNASEKSTTYLAFCKDQQDKYDFFFATEVVRRNDYNKTLPMYVPIKAAPEYKNHKNSDKTTYYNKGYWMNYPENTGYKLQIYDGTGNGAKEVASIRFPYSSNTIMPLTVSVDLEAGKTYGFKILREDNTYFSNEGTMTANSNGWSFTYGINKNCGLQTTLAGDYTFTLKYAAPDQNNLNDYQYCVDVVYPVSVGDYRVVYQDKAEWSLGKAHDENWYHPSYAIKKNNSTTEEKIDIVSFFIAKNHTPSMKFQECTAINGQKVTWADVTNGTITIPNDVVTAAGVYNFIVKQPAGGESISVESVEPYTGNYYIRVDAMDGKWGNYKTDPDNRMTYSAFSENRSKNKFGELFSHYATKWCEEGTNVKFTIANDYSPCISDTLIQDNGNPFGNINEHGNLNSNEGKYAANIRFMWNRHTNKISRAYVAGSTFTDRQFLILKADKEFKNSAGGNLSNEGDNHNAHQAIFQDTQNWIYERTIQVQPSTRVKLYACYPTTDVANAQYFRGTYDNNNATWNEDNSVQILGGTGTSWNTIRIIYDFKTNRLMAAWIPTGEIDGEKSLQADMMILREHQEDAACITFKDTDDKLLNIQTVYGVLRFNRWVLNNRKATGGHEALDVKDQKSIYERALYFISFPFNVHLSDVFGFGTYGTHWVISEYNGKRRAERGYFADNCVNEDCTNWDYIWDPSNVTLEANKGYLLSLDLDLMKHDNISFWAHNINTVELCFPSYEHVQTIQQTSYTMPKLGEEYKCKINHNTPDGDRRVKDSYWRCIGVPSFANYDGSLSDGSNNEINWKSDYTWKADDAAFPFLYEWNVSDNALSVQNTKQYTFRSTFAYLVQNGNQIKWSAVNAKPSSPIVARQRSEEQESSYDWKITLTRGEVQEDQAFVCMTNQEEVTAEFDFGQDLSKELNYGRSDIYTLIGYERAAANSMPLSDSTTIVPLGLDIEQDGDYTIAMPEGVESVGVTVLDAETGERTNLSIGMDYTISLNQGVCHNRLYLEISPIQQTTTDIEYTNQGTREQSVRKVLIDGKLYIVCEGVVYDAQGKRL